MATYMRISIGKISVFPIYIDLKQSPDKQEIVFFVREKSKKKSRRSGTLFCFFWKQINVEHIC